MRVDRPLGIVAVDDQHFAFADVVQIAGEKRRKSRLAYTSLLIADDGDVPRIGCLLIGSLLVFSWFAVSNLTPLPPDVNIWILNI